MQSMSMKEMKYFLTIIIPFIHYPFDFPMPNAERIHVIKKTSISAATIVEPTGVPLRMEISIPITAQDTDNRAEQMVTLLKLRHTRMADIGGKIIRAEISSEPTRFIARTIITAITTAIRRLYSFTFTPAERAKSSSKVTAKSLL